MRTPRIAGAIVEIAIDSIWRYAARPILFRMDPEDAHRLTMKGLSMFSDAITAWERLQIAVKPARRRR